jgi:hypothetical protein
MLSVKAFYDGKNIKLLENLEEKKPGKVIVTFLDDEDPNINNNEILFVAEKGGSFDFLNDPSEDIYSDKDLKVKYK